MTWRMWVVVVALTIAMVLFGAHFLYGTTPQTFDGDCFANGAECVELD